MQERGRTQKRTQWSYAVNERCPVGTVPMETRTGPHRSTFSTRTLNFDS